MKPARKERRRARATSALLAFGALFTAGGSARAAGGAATDAYEGIREDAALDVHGLVDVYFQHRFDHANGSPLAFRAFDVRDDEPSLNFLRLTLAHAPGAGPTDSGPRFGFRLDAGVGDTPNEYLRSDPAATDHPDLSRAFSYVEQAFATVAVPLGRGVAVDVGKFGTPIGLEENESLLNWNYSRSFLYTLAEPTFHSGARMTYPLSDTLAVTAFWLNGWNTNVLAGSGMRSFAGAVTWSPNRTLQLVLAYAGGLERAPEALSDPTLTFRNVLDGYVTYALTERITLASTFDAGHDERNGGSTFWGVAGYLRVTALDWLSGTVRAEHLGDPQGLLTGLPQRMAEATATVEARSKVGSTVVLGRAEYRRDVSDEHAFEGNGSSKSTRRDTFTVGLLAAF